VTLPMTMCVGAIPTILFVCGYSFGRLSKLRDAQNGHAPFVGNEDSEAQLAALARLLAEQSRSLRVAALEASELTESRLLLLEERNALLEENAAFRLKLEGAAS